ncbi:hypothetical protein ILUMI_10353 [Ignelater luminosus]|uniref:RNA-directed DNA polymerase n=1 Tax=Ignelater luminosus TaxID=2038154 RepID=A0A8K0CY36_IGNLU|nr:hypothetical protein ILUMI_10353 [Ignelater luminosus]
MLEDIVGEEERFEIMKGYHLGKTNHRGITETVEAISKRYYFPKIYEQVNRYINQCNVCQQAKYERNPLKIVPNVTEISSRPFVIINIDLFFMDNQIFLTIIDQFSRFLQMYPIQRQNQVEIMDQLTKFVSTFPTPSKIIADNQFNTVVFKEFCSLYKIVYHFTTPRSSTELRYTKQNEELLDGQKENEEQTAGNRQPGKDNITRETFVGDTALESLKKL